MLDENWRHGRYDLYCNVICDELHGGKNVEPECYIAGPMRGVKKFNYPVFNFFAARFRDHGWKVHTPAENDNDVLDEIVALEQDANPLKVYMRQDLQDVLTSDVVFVLPGWEKSKGARLEVHVAWETDTPVYDIVTFQEIEKPSEWLVDRQDDLSAESATPVSSGPQIDFGPEERATDETTGGSKGRKQAVFANIPVYAQIMKARVHGFGIFKYPDTPGAKPNWKRGMPWSWMYDAAQRHLLSFWGGEVINPESGLPHLAHAAWMLDTLLEYEHAALGTDDRPGSQS